MTEDALMLVGCDAGRTRDVATTHAYRLRDRDVADDVHVALYDDEPVRDVEETFADIGADVAYAAPLTLGHTHETRDPDRRLRVAVVSQELTALLVVVPALPAPRVLDADGEALLGRGVEP
jgi:hypothetical protein